MIKSMQMEPTGDSTLICPLCEGSGNLMRMVKKKVKFTQCICFGGCLYL